MLYLENKERSGMAIPYICQRGGVIAPVPLRIPRLLRNLWGSAGRFRETFRIVKSLSKKDSAEPQRFCRTVGAKPSFSCHAYSSPTEEQEHTHTHTWRQICDPLPSSVRSYRNTPKFAPPCCGHPMEDLLMEDGVQIRVGLELAEHSLFRILSGHPVAIWPLFLSKD